MIASIRQKFTTPRGHGMTGEETTTAEIADANYGIDDVIWHEGRRLVVVGREWRDGVLAVMCTELVQLKDGAFDEYVAQRAAKKGRAV